MGLTRRMNGKGSVDEESGCAQSGWPNEKRKTVTEIGGFNNI